jgi:LexA-binding, inner membrane-associated putative hydrolase
MPSPLGHAIAGLTVHVLVAPGQTELLDWRRAALVTGAALAADLDLVVGLIDGRNHHGNESHSLGFAILAGLLAAVFGRVAGWPEPRALAIAVGLSWSSHVLLDYLNVDTHPPIGIMAFWPASLHHFKVPWPIFLDIGRTLDWTTVRHDAIAAAWETVVLLPILVSAFRYRTRNGKGGPWREGSKASP